MKTIKRWIKNLKWLFNHPPTTIISDDKKYGMCEFCGQTIRGGLNIVGQKQQCAFVGIA